MKCPRCGKDGATELAEEVDIGVGTQRHIYGAECQDCGQIACCVYCGVWDGQPHAEWCDGVKSIGGS